MSRRSPPSEWRELGILIVLAMIVVAAVILALASNGKIDASRVLDNVATGLIGALGGYALARANRSDDPPDKQGD